MKCFRCDGTKEICNLCGESAAVCTCLDDKGEEDFIPCEDCQILELKSPTLKEVVKAIGRRAETWKGHCHQISCAILEKKLVKGVTRYGHWLGPVNPESIFYQRHINAGFTQHGWIEDPEGLIIDPTRWVFEARDPYIYHGPCKGWYDVGGQQFRNKLSKPCPEFSSKDVKVELPQDKRLVKLFKDMCGGRILTAKQLFWIANLPPHVFGERAKDVYAFIEESGHAGLIPTDNRKLVMEGKPW